MRRRHWATITALTLVAPALVSSGCGIVSGLYGTGASPYTREVVITVLRNVPDTLNQVPVTNATVTVTQTTSNQPSISGSAASSTTTVSQTMGTDTTGRALFRVEPGESYTVAISASGYASATIVVSPSYYGPDVIQRVVTLAATS